jgi:DNA-binding SARP family transcriptional activator/predicted ATPase
MHGLSLYLLGPPRLERDGEPIHIGRTKALALLAYLAVEGGRHRRESLVTLLSPEFDASRARAELRRTLSVLNSILGEGWLVVDRETVGFCLPHGRRGRQPLRSHLRCTRSAVQVIPQRPQGVLSEALRRQRSGQPDGSGHGLWLDVDQFRLRLQECRGHDHRPTDVCPQCARLLIEAPELYRGDFMAGFTLPGSLEFEEWQFFQAQSLRDQLTSVLQHLIRWHCEQAELDDALDYARRWLAMDPIHEPAHRQLMRLYAEAGQQAAALRQYRICEQTLVEELGVPPSPQTVELMERIRAGEDLAPLAEPKSAIPHNLPPQPSRFVGRETELEQLDDLIANPDVRLITIVGPGGIGKTRLALAAAERQLNGAEPPFPDGVFFVPLARMSTSDEMAPVVAEALSFRVGGPEDSRSGRRQVLDYLRDKQMLLVLDNFEYLLRSPPARLASTAHPAEAFRPAKGSEVSSPCGAEYPSEAPPETEEGERGGVSFVADVLHTASKLQLLVTSRERLPLREEQIFPIIGLEYAGEASDDKADYAAAQLFLQAARRAEPSFELAPNEAASLSRVCRLVEGMPLAIELAATWADILSLSDIAGEIQRGLDFLATEWQDAPERHHSVRAAFNASWRRLTETEQAVFAQLCTFRGGFTREAAMEVAGADLRTLSGLAAKSLLNYSRVRERYEIHELLRQYGCDRLAADPELENTARDRYSAFFCDALQRLADHIDRGDDLHECIDFEADWANVGAAWEIAVQKGHASRLESALDGLFDLILITNRFGEETAAMLQLAIRGLNDGPKPLDVDSKRVLAKALLRFSALAAEHWRSWKRARPMIAESRTLLESLAQAGCDTRHERGWLHLMTGWSLRPDCAKALPHYEKALKLHREAGYLGQAAYRLMDVGSILTISGEHNEARRYFEEGLALFRSFRNLHGVHRSLLLLGRLARCMVDHREAQRRYEEALEVARTQGSQGDMAIALTEMGYLAGFLGDFRAEADYLRKSSALLRGIGYREYLSVTLAQLGQAHWFCGEFAQAYALLEESLAIAEETGSPSKLLMPVAYCSWLEAAAGNYPSARAHVQNARALYQSCEYSYLPHLGIPQTALGWVAVAEGDNEEARKTLQQTIATFQQHLRLDESPEFIAWCLAALGRAEHGAGNHARAKEHLREALRICVDIRAFIPLLHLMPIIPVVLADEDDPRLKERAVELYAMATSHPFVAKAQLFEDVAGRYIRASTADLPPDVVSAAQERGRALDWWETAEALLEELDW